MPAIVEAEKCEACADCVEACPNGSITIEANVAIVNKDDCIDCTACAEACTKGAITMGD
jgi:NAD-dependent dihydropyrimidine dehydrogenase PreA subunit